MGEIVAAAAGVHAPQLLSRPPFEDQDMLQAGIDALAAFGDTLEEAGAEVLILIGTDHLEAFWLAVVPQFLLVVSERVEARYASWSRSVPGHPAFGAALLDGAVHRSIDLCYSQEVTLGHAFLTPIEYVLGDRGIPVVPLLVNVYLPPLPSPRRCYEVGRALRAVIDERPERVAILASGGMSHFPGTARYYEPAVDFDRWVIQQVERGDWDELLDLTPVELDEVGAGELLTWFVMLGAIGPRPGRFRSFQELPHHDHGVVQFIPPIEPGNAPQVDVPRYGGLALTQETYRYYRFPDPASLPMNRLLHRLIVDTPYRTRFVDDRGAALAEVELAEGDRTVAEGDEFPALGLQGAHPLLALSARQLLEQERRSRGLPTSAI